MTRPETRVSEVMLRRPKTLTADASVAEARRALESTSVKLLLFVDDDRFRGAVTEIPEDADPDGPALAFAQPSPVTVTRETPASQALERLAHRPNGRLVVLDGDRLVGLVCLAQDGMTFCGFPSSAV